MRDPGSISLPASGGKIWPVLPTAHSMKSPAVVCTSCALCGEAGDCRRLPSARATRARDARCGARSSDAGLISIARTHRGSVNPVSVTGRNHLSCVCAASVYGCDLITRSGAPNCFASCQPVGIGEAHRRGHVLRIAQRRAGVHPADERRDLRVAEAAVVLELLDADGAVDVPRRHQALRHLPLDLVRVLARVLVGDERHRADRIRLMADLALLLQDRRDVLRERDGCRSRRRRHATRRRQRGDRQDPTRQRLQSSSPSWGLPYLTVTLMNPFVQQHCAWPAPATPDASLARTRTM